MSSRKFKKAKVNIARFKWSPELLDIITTHLGIAHVTPAHLKQISAAVKTLSDRFISLPTKYAREEGQALSATQASATQNVLIDVYGNDPELLKAYSAYYLLVNIPKIVEIIEVSNLPLHTISRILDIGTGSGTAIIAFLIARHRAGITTPLDITAMDYSNDFLELAKKLIQIFRHHCKTDGKDIFQKADLTQDKSLKSLPVVASITGSVNLVMASNILAELSPTVIKSFPERLDQLLNPDDFLLLMEPAQRFPARQLLKARDRLCNFGWKPIYPCPGNYMCPALKHCRDWCHHRLKWEPPKLVKMIDGLTGMNKHLLNFTPLIMRKTANKDEARDASANWYRVISEVRQLKGKLEVVICGEFSNTEHQKICMLENKYFSRYNKLFPDLARYDQIRLDKVENRANRLILSETSWLTKEVDDGDRG